MSQLLDFWGKLLLSILNLSFNLVDCLGNLLECLILLVIEKLLLIGHALNLILDLGVPLDSLLSLEIFHELAKILSSSLKNSFGSSENGDL